MTESLEALSSIDYWGFCVSLSIVICAFLAIKMGIEKLGEQIGWEVPWLKNKRIQKELSEAVVGLQKEVNQHKENRIHDREQSQKIQKELVDGITALANKIDDLQDKIHQNELEKKIDKLRSEIINFATALKNKNYKPSLDHYQEIFRKYDEYERILEENNMTNGLCAISIKLIRKRYEEDLLNGELED